METEQYVEAAGLNNFIAYETHANRSLGRGYKVDRQEVVATLVALREWFAMDHEERFAVQKRRLQTIALTLAGLPYVKAEPTWPRQGPWMQLNVVIDEGSAGEEFRFDMRGVEERRS